MDKSMVKRLAAQCQLNYPAHDAKTVAALVAFARACCAYQREKMLEENKPEAK